MASSPRAPKAAGVPAPSLDAGQSPMVRAAWGYFVEDMSQAEIAERLGVSRASVHNYLRQARDEGLVRISLDPAVLARSQTASSLAERFGLEAVYLVPDVSSVPLESVARAAAMWLDDLVAPDATLGVAWGETVHRVAELLPRRAYPAMTVVQLVGSMALPFRFTAESCTSLIAERFGAACATLHAPAVLSSTDLVSALSREPLIAGHLARFQGLDAALFAVGLATAESHIVQSGVASRAELDFYRGRGAAAVIAGRFIDADGRPISGPLDGRIIGIELERLRRVPARVAVCAGTERVPALHAALRGGFATHLVTDAASAFQLLDLSRRDEPVR
ncbi:sugar-binding transcriptional regulator [Antarcticirhabdus aurantiaca]|uniref:Sugar-binding transcriptional regulator n=1 Tax=Antarcticirhabdus aurantiaca TaxID=2606717 RepID=A0ACD4NH48_9HYPH|nr:sugar-binding transcriptional regulator [Antarcticirhabdus aurantiaca]WAJ26125.1 sugar-binding transcriptional regulator [Jeongeuplla avenae]